MSESTAVNNNTENLPWLIFTLRSHYYAIHSRYVTGIMVPPDSITPVPEAPDIYRGVVEIRSEVYPVLDMRKMFGFPSIDTECKEFTEMMDAREKDYIEWVNELKRSVEADTEFTLTTDPHACKFGLWYDDFRKHSANSSYVLNKIDAPHCKLHETADLIAEARKITDPDEKKHRTDELLKLVTKDYAPEILSIIDEAKRRYHSSYRETLVLLSTGDANLAIAVDKVVAVDKVTIIKGGSNMSKIFNSQYFIDVARNSRVDNDILLINDAKIIEKAEKEVPKQESPEE